MPELKEELEARLRRTRQTRLRSTTSALRSIAREERIVAVAKAFRLAYRGKPLPIHFDVVVAK
jgi:hypothetical protein